MVLVTELAPPVKVASADSPVNIHPKGEMPPNFDWNGKSIGLRPPAFLTAAHVSLKEIITGCV